MGSKIVDIFPRRPFTGEEDSPLALYDLIRDVQLYMMRLPQSERSEDAKMRFLLSRLEGPAFREAYEVHMSSALLDIYPTCEEIFTMLQLTFKQKKCKFELVEYLLSVRQTGDLRHYMEEFTCIRDQFPKSMPGWSVEAVEDIMLCAFVIGLQPSIKDIARAVLKDGMTLDDLFLQLRRLCGE